MAEQKNKTNHGIITDEQIEKIRSLASTIEYGTITLVFQDGVLIQIDKNEKIRLH